MPGTFEKQSNNFKDDILDKNSLIVTIENGVFLLGKNILEIKVYL